jgi:tripartite ATP-independent transporter DctM subunit
MSIPELRRRGYPEQMIIGTLAGAGTLGLLIPPSIILIVYGVTVNESIARLFIAGILPGIMLALLFMGYIAVHATLRPEIAPETAATVSLAEKLRNSISLVPVILLILAVLGSIYTGVATATEAAVLGVVGGLILSALQGSLTRESFTDSLMGATRTSCMIALILAGSAFLTLAMGFTGLPRKLALAIDALDLAPLTLILALTLFYVLLGCFLDGISIVVLTMAVVEPMIRQAGIDLLWFGIYLVIVVEMAQITPPVGFNLFVLQGMTGHEIGYIARAALPMFFIMCLAVAIVVAFPQIVTFLPSRL